MVLSTRFFLGAMAWLFLGFCRGTNGIHVKEVTGWKTISNIHNKQTRDSFFVAPDNDDDAAFSRRMAATTGTGGPTASPAPSPSPSSSPTIKPTHTGRPTLLPSIGPTESFKPSPSPSLSPSDSPSDRPTQVPSTSPSKGPTLLPSQNPSELPSRSPSRSPTFFPSIHPTSSPAPTPSPSVSSQPTQVPSVRPTIAPSQVPSHHPSRFPTTSPSNQPSRIPSASPSLLPSQVPSVFPTDLPTVTASLSPSGFHTIRMTTTLAIVLGPLSALLEGRVIRTFELQTMQFIQTTLPDLGNTTSVEILAVTITNQTMVARRRRRRKLQSDENTNRQLEYASLRIQFMVIGEFVTGTPPPGFNFAQYVDTGFLQHYNDYIYRLSSVDPVFRPLQVGGEESTLKSQPSSSKTVSAASLGMIVSGSIVAMGMAFAASIYAIRRRRPKGMQRMLEHGNDTFVEEVQPSGSGTPDAAYSQYSSERDSRESPASHSSGTYSTRSDEMHSYDGEGHEGPTSPNTMESGARSMQSECSASRRSLTTEEIMHRDMAIEFSLENHKEEITHVGDVYEIYESESEERIEKAIMRYATRPARGMSGRLLDTDSDEDVTDNHDNVARAVQVRNAASSIYNNNNNNVKPSNNYNYNNNNNNNKQDNSYNKRQENSYNYTNNKHDNNYNYTNNKHDSNYFAPEELDGYDHHGEHEEELYDEEIHYTRSIDPPASEDGAPVSSIRSNAVDPSARKASDAFNPSRRTMISLLDDNTTVGDTTVGESIATSGRESYGSDGGFSLGLKLTDEVLATFNVARLEVEEEDTPRKLIPRMSHSRFPELYAHTEDPYEELLENSTTPTSSAFSGVEPSEEYTDASVMGTLGARPISRAEMAHYQEKNAYKGPQVKRTGLYDVFAPPGPIGMVVDTTRDGPVVHTLKTTSPLIGLIYPGDLIVGLDDIDTRSMTAATLTRLMSKKSQQTERKITLLAVDK